MDEKPQTSLAINYRGISIWPRLGRYAIEWLLIILVAYFYAGKTLLNFDATQLQQTGEHNESLTLPLLAEIGLKRYGEIPLWNPYMLTGFPLVGDFLSHFWHPVATLSVWIWGGINGMKVSVFLTFVAAGLGQWLFAHAFGLRGLVRLWTALIYMLSGGLALLWRSGWYELLLGAAWFPWCFAAVWWAVTTRGYASLALSALVVAMVLTTGGGYYPFYLFGSLGVVVVVAMLFTRSVPRWIQLRRAVFIAVLSAGITAVMLLPWIDGYRYTARDVMPDLEQHFSQPIMYALFNYVISQPEWYRAEVLGTAGGWNWFYIGSLPLVALTLAPLAYSRAPRRRAAIAAAGVLTLFILMWHANKYPPFKYVYDWIPFLYSLRFPNRLLIIAASPLLVLAGFGLQYVYRLSRVVSRKAVLLVSGSASATQVNIPLWRLVVGAWLVYLALNVRSVYEVNKGVAFAKQFLNPKALQALRWLKNYDPGLYYINIGGGFIYWDWMPAAYMLEMPVINFRYSRSLTSLERQRAPESPFAAKPKYMLALPDQPRPDNAQQLQDFEGVGLWYLPGALPFAFSAPPNSLQPFTTLAPEQAVALDVHWSRLNRVEVKGAPARDGDLLIVLVSNYPGWKLSVDGQPQTLAPANDYLGAVMLPGQHTYTFDFFPAQYAIGLGISLASLLLAAGLILADSPVRRILALPGRLPAPYPVSSDSSQASPSP